MRDAQRHIFARRGGEALKRVKSFRRDEDGAMVVFTLFILAMMLMVGGMAVDMMRFETYRARLQSTLDRAVLAAADLDVCLEGEGVAEAVVNDYVLKAGFEEQLDSVSVIQGFNSCEVAATASIEVNTIFMQMVGVDELASPAASSAVEALDEVEISLVLDVSGSMASNNRLVNMRNAAREFVGEMFNGFDDESLSMSIVPYSTQVNLGPALAAQYTRNYAHGYSYCIDLPASTYGTTSLPTTATYDQAAHVDVDGYASSWSNRYASRFVCNPDSRAHVMPFATNEGAIDTMIANLQSNEWTSIEMGAKWGVALLDPSSQPVVNGLISAGAVSGDVAGRPLDFGTTGSLKVMVLMTDGENTQHYELDTNYRSGDSDVWKASSGVYYVQDEEQGNWDGDSTWYEDYYRPQNDNFTNSRSGNRMTWPELFNEVSLDGHAWYFRRGQTNNNSVWNDWYYDLFTTTTTADKDERLDDLCTAAKSQGIIIFAIGFEVTDRAADVMESCASSPSHFYRVNGLEISTAFSSIAANITSLRLVQ
ncbi:TadE/TadG family type IV pilus assembly protein [Flavimaricola marinus]|nr:TadE/TadG family type IV pilus assembly protein [Flavimaricola marinus]